MADLSNTFGLPFEEQLNFFRDKLNLPTARWDDIMRAAHDRAFVVAGAAKADLLDDLRQAVDKAVNRGMTLADFRKEFAAIVERQGWHGWTGEGTAKGEGWRTRVIYETNIRSSYAAGRYRQLTSPAMIQAMPYWRYVHNDSVAHPRPLHQLWGDMRLTLRWDHPFWNTHFPPCGWGCRCRIVATDAPGAGDATQPPEGWDAINPKTGEPVGIDKGWGYAPGKSVANVEQAILDKAKKLPDPLAKALIADVESVALPRISSVEDYVAHGHSITTSLPDAEKSPQACFEALLKKLENEVGIGAPCKTASKGEGAKLAREASQRYPDSWTRVADDLGPFYTKAAANTRGHCLTTSEPPSTGTRYRLQDFGVVDYETGAGYMMVRKGDVGNAVHEYAHRLQSALPGLDDLFQQMHRKRTAGDILKRLKDLVPNSGYGYSEVTREDHYTNPYQGKEYTGGADGGALEVMTMGFEDVLGQTDWNRLSGYRADRFKTLYTDDREMFDFVVGLLFGWVP